MLGPMGVRLRLAVCGVGGGLELDALAGTVRASADGQGDQTLGEGAHPVPLQGSVPFVYATRFAPAEPLGEQVRVFTVEIRPG